MFEQSLSDSHIRRFPRICFERLFLPSIDSVSFLAEDNLSKVPNKLSNQGELTLNDRLLNLLDRAREFALCIPAFDSVSFLAVGVCLDTLCVKVSAYCCYCLLKCSRKGLNASVLVFPCLICVERSLVDLSVRSNEML